jgi:hypothetical protein
LENATAGPRNPTGRRAGEAPLEIPRDRWGRPLITPPDGGKPRPYTRASTLGSTLEDQTNLGEWKKRVVAYGLARRRDLILAAASIQTWDGPTDKRALADIAEQAMQHAEAGAAATIGTALHALTERLDRGEPIPDVGEDRYALDAYSELMAHFTVRAIESFIVCDDHEVAGTFDRLVSPRAEMKAPDGTRIGPDESIVADIKTAATNAWFGLKFACQISEYSHGTPYLPESGRTQWPEGKIPNQSWGLIIHVPSGGNSADLHWVDLQAGRQLSDLAVTVREWRKRKELVVPAEAPRIELGPEVEPDPLLAQVDAVPADANMRQAFKDLWKANASHWTPELTSRVQEQLARRDGAQ